MRILTNEIDNEATTYGIISIDNLSSSLIKTYTPMYTIHMRSSSNYPSFIG